MLNNNSSRTSQPPNHTAPLRIEDHDISDFYDDGIVYHVACDIAEQFESAANRIADKLDKDAVQRVVSLLHESIEDALQSIIDMAVERAFDRLVELEAALETT